MTQPPHPEDSGAGEPPDRLDPESVPAVDGDASGDGIRSDELPAFFRVLDGMCNVLLVVMFTLLLVVVGYNVFGRVFLGQSLATADEAARYLFIWVIFLGASVAHFRGEHISVTFLVAKAPGWLQTVFAAARELLILSVLGLILWGSIRVMQTTFGTSALLGVPSNLINLAVPVSAVLMALVSIYRLARLAMVRKV